MDSPLVKVVVTSYNRPEWLRLAVDSVLAQTYPAVHIVIVDDASTNAAGEVAREYAAAHPGRITAIVKPGNLGVADTVRQGIGAGPSAPYAAFIHDDDLWDPDKLAVQMGLFADDHSLGLVYCEARIIDKDGQPDGRLFSDLFGRYSSRSFDEVLWEDHACASTFLVTDEVARIAMRTMPERLRTWDYWVLLIAAGYASIAGIDRPHASYRESGTGMHVTREPETWRDTTLAREALFSRNAPLIARAGGLRNARRKVALRTLDVALRQLWDRQWREYFWQSSRLVRQRQLRPTVWLAIHTVRLMLRKPGVPWPEVDPPSGGQPEGPSAAAGE